MQSEIDSLREINSKLLAEITELRKENAEVKAENIEVKAENVKLKHALEEHEARFTDLEQRDKEKTNLIAKLDDDIKEIKQEQIAINLSVQSDTFIPKSPINSESQVTPQSSVSLPIEDNSNVENSPSVTQPICPGSKSLEEKEDDEFIDSVYKEKVSNEIRQRRREKKLQAQESLLTLPEEKMSQDLNSVTQPCNSTTSEEKICSELDSKCKKGKGVDKLKQELFAPELPSQVPIEQNHVTKISETAGPGKSSIDEAS